MRKTQARLDGYLHDEYAHTAHVFGADIAEYRAIYDDWRREILSRLTGRQLDALVPLSGEAVAQEGRMNDPRGPATFAPDTDAPAFDHAALARAIDALRTTAARDRAGGHAAQESSGSPMRALLTLAVPRAFGGRKPRGPGSTTRSGRSRASTARSRISSGSSACRW